MPMIPGSLITFIGCDASRHQFSPMDICYIEADNIYSRIICQDQTLPVRHSICLMEELLPDYFLRIHRSFLINRYSVITLCHQTVTMANGFRLPVPEKRYQWLLERLLQYSVRPS